MAILPIIGQMEAAISLANGLTRKDIKVQVATLLHIAGAEILELYNTLV